VPAVVHFGREDVRRGKCAIAIVAGGTGCDRDVVDDDLRDDAGLTGIGAGRDHAEHGVDQHTRRRIRQVVRAIGRTMLGEVGAIVGGVTVDVEAE